MRGEERRETALAEQVELRGMRAARGAAGGGRGGGIAHALGARSSGAARAIARSGSTRRRQGSPSRISPPCSARVCGMHWPITSPRRSHRPPPCNDASGTAARSSASFPPASVWPWFRNHCETCDARASSTARSNITNGLDRLSSGNGLDAARKFVTGKKNPARWRGEWSSGYTAPLRCLGGGAVGLGGADGNFKALTAQEPLNAQYVTNGPVPSP
uniref:B'46 n=1 Tax=Burkholderia glumae TaxID=337 RepID=Q9AJC3_BURGL|nr:B'46 [Burkholderia glumae]